MTPRLLIFLKAPRAGTVKTRLALEVGEQEALRIYRWLVERQLAAVPAGWPVEIRFTPDEAKTEMQSWLGPGRAYRAQGGGDLGARLARGFHEARSEGGWGAIAIGGDCPELDRSTLEAAARELATVDVVLGPAVDGGYYLIGLKRNQPQLFEGIAWSSATVLDATLRRAAAAGLNWALLKAKEDIDDFAGWRRFETGASERTNVAMKGLSIVIPALDEAERIGGCIAAAKASFPVAVVIVVDGGSRDGTAALAAAAGAQVVQSVRGRGRQCAMGAAASRTEWLLFLHADTLLPAHAGKVVEAFTTRGSAQIATFRLRFDRAGWFLRACGWCTRFDSVFTRFGDQGILIRRAFYEAIGGFPEWPLFEDVALLQRAREHGRVPSLPAAVTTSARRFEANGHYRQQWLNARLLWRYLWGASPHALAEYYRTGSSALRKRAGKRFATDGGEAGPAASPSHPSGAADAPSLQP